VHSDSDFPPLVATDERSLSKTEIIKYKPGLKLNSATKSLTNGQKNNVSLNLTLIE